MTRSILAFALFVFALACDDRVVDPPVRLVSQPDLACPGGTSCSATLADDVLLAAAAKDVVTPVGFEIANAAYLTNDRPGSCAPEAPRQGPEPRCGELSKKHVQDCGTDALCEQDVGYPGPDADGTEGDGSKNDWFFDCGLDRMCPGNLPEAGDLAMNGFDDDGDGAVDDTGYPGTPDEGEGDGKFQGLWLAGYGNNRPALGVKDAQDVRAVVFRQGDSTLAIVTVDAVGLFYDVQEQMTAALEALKPGEVDLLLLQASHTHEAPDTMGQWGYVNPSLGLQLGHGRNDRLMADIVSKGAAVVAAALDALVPVEVRVGQVNPGVDGLVDDGRDPAFFNDALTAISLEDSTNGDVVATLVSWGNHPESLDSRNNFVSADYVHALRNGVEVGIPATSRAPRGGVALYLQGAVGGIMGVNSFPITGVDGTEYPRDQKTFARTDAYGTVLADLAFQALESAEVLARTPLRFSVKAYEAPVENVAFHVGIFNDWFDRKIYKFDRNANIGGENLPHIKTGTAVVYLGDIGMVTAPGELFPETFVGYDPANSFGVDTITPGNPNPPDMTKAPAGPYLRDLLGARFAFPLGLCQDEMGYLVPTFDFKLGQAPYISEPEGDHYEETNSIGPKAVPLLLENLDALFAFEKARAE